MSHGAAPPAGTPPVLSFHDVTLNPIDRSQCYLRKASFRVARGELLLLHKESESQCLPLADGAQGMIEPDSGTVEFLGFDWTRIGAQQAAQLRGRITRVLPPAANNWIENLSVRDNVLLAQLHHTNRSAEDVEAESLGIAHRIGLQRLSARRPHEVTLIELQRSALVRAFLGAPDLILLEHATSGIFPAAMPALVELVGEARERGAAVVWITDRKETMEQVDLAPTCRSAVRGSGIVAYDSLTPDPAARYP